MKGTNLKSRSSSGKLSYSPPGRKRDGRKAPGESYILCVRCDSSNSRQGRRQDRQGDKADESYILCVGCDSSNSRQGRQRATRGSAAKQASKQTDIEGKEPTCVYASQRIREPTYTRVNVYESQRICEPTYTRVNKCIRERCCAPDGNHYARRDDATFF